MNDMDKMIIQKEKGEELTIYQDTMLWDNPTISVDDLIARAQAYKAAGATDVIFSGDDYQGIKMCGVIREIESDEECKNREEIEAENKKRWDLQEKTPFGNRLCQYSVLDSYIQNSDCTLLPPDIIEKFKAANGKTLEMPKKSEDNENKEDV